MKVYVLNRFQTDQTITPKGYSLRRISCELIQLLSNEIDCRAILIQLWEKVVEARDELH